MILINEHAPKLPLGDFSDIFVMVGGSADWEKNGGRDPCEPKGRTLLDKVLTGRSSDLILVSHAYLGGTYAGW